MSLPIIGEKSRAEKLAQKQDEADIQYQLEMREKLRQWEIDNSCLVGAVLNTTQSISDMVFKAEMYFKKLDENGIKRYKNIADNKDLISKQSNRNKKETS